MLAVEDDAIGLEALPPPSCASARSAAMRRATRHAERVALLVRRVADADGPRPRPHIGRGRVRARGRVSSFESRTPRRCASPGTTAPTVTGPAHAPATHFVDPDHDLFARRPAPAFEAKRGSRHQRERIKREWLERPMPQA